MPITEREFMNKYVGEYKTERNELVAKYCPFCNGGAKNDKYTFYLNEDTHTFICHRGKCSQYGHFQALAQTKGEIAQYYADYCKKSKKTNKITEVQKSNEYVRPKIQLTEADSDVVNYFKNRGISEDVTKKYVYTAMVQGERKVAAFKFFNGNEHCLTKFRYINKDAKVKETQEKGGLSVLWNFQNIDKNKPVILTEGMIDALSCIEAGHENVVSVPSGCQNFKWIENNYDEIQKINDWILYMDNDEAGDKMKEELILKLGADKISVVNHDLKDANEELNLYGKELLSYNITKAKKIPVDGILNIEDINVMDLSKVKKVRTGIEFIDRYIGGLMFPSLNVWTGKRGEGKSTLLTQCIIRAIEEDTKCFVYSGELSASLFKLCLYRQIATERHIITTKNEITQQEYNSIPREVEIAIDTWIKNKLFLYDDTHANTEDELLKIMNIAYKRYDCRVFILDNLTTIKLNANRGGKYEAQSDFTNKCREFVLNNKINLNLVVHPRKSNGSAFDNDTVGGSGDITNLAFNVINIKRIKNEGDLEENMKNFYKNNGMNLALIKGILEISKNRYFGIIDSCPLKFNAKDTRFSLLNYPGDVVRTWEKYLPNGYKDNLNHVYTNATAEFIAQSEEEKEIALQENELTEEDLLLEGLELEPMSDDCPF